MQPFEADTNGIPWAKLTQLSDGMYVTVTGFDCLDDGAICRVHGSEDGLYIRCDHGRHYLTGQLEVDNNTLIGVYHHVA